MKYVYAGIISTGLVIVAGIAIIVPAIILPYLPVPSPIILGFEVNDEKNLPEWCFELQKIFQSQNIKSLIFFTGKIAEQHPNCVSNFGKSVDIGSKTYSNKNLSEISDYSIQLEEIKRGKAAIDKAGNIDSKIFRAPNGVTDENIYSLLSRANITADFSYENQFNKFDDGKFIKHDLKKISSTNEIKQFLKIDKNSESQKLVLLLLDNSMNSEEIEQIILELKNKKVVFVNPSSVTESDLTKRGIVR